MPAVTQIPGVLVTNLVTVTGLDVADLEVPAVARMMGILVKTAQLSLFLNVATNSRRDAACPLRGHMGEGGNSGRPKQEFTAELLQASHSLISALLSPRGQPNVSG